MQHGPGMHMGNQKKKLVSFEVALKSKKLVAEDTYSFTFEKPEGFQFNAGQHIRMSLIDSSETDAEGDKRFLTMASTPQEPDLTFAMRMRDTAFKRTLSRMQPGEKVVIQKLLGESPHGAFALHEDASKPAVFVVGGIGIVPAYAMVKNALQRNLPHKMFLFYSNRRPEDAPFLVELQSLARQNSSFTLIATMTEPEKSAQIWQGETGVIDQELLKKYVVNLSSPIYYVAGLPEMVSAMKTLLTNSGVKKDNIRAEGFTGFNLNDLPGSASTKWKKYLPFVVIGMILVAMLVTHIGGLTHADLLNAFSLSNPISYILIVLLLDAAAFKVFVVLRLKRTLHSKQSQEKLSIRDVMEAHMPAKKEK